MKCQVLLSVKLRNVLLSGFYLHSAGLIVSFHLLNLPNVLALSSALPVFNVV